MLRNSLAPQAAAMGERLLVIGDTLKAMDPNIYQQWAEKISESILDLNFVERDLDIVSLRLSRMIGEKELRKQKSKDQPQTFSPFRGHKKLYPNIKIRSDQFSDRPEP